MTNEQIINLFKRGNSKVFIVNLEFQDLKRNYTGIRNKQAKIQMKKQAIQNVEQALLEDWKKLN